LLLDAAVAVVRRDGAQRLTLDAVAKEASVSKGGLLYHFASKRELLDAMVDRWLAEWQAELDEQPGSFADAFVRSSHIRDSAERATEFALLAALVAEPEVLETVRSRYEIWQDRVAREGGDPVDATVARLAADGLWLADLLGLAAPQGELREAVLGRLLELTRRD
jgi:AcrR family transcriptional regulator